MEWLDKLNESIKYIEDNLQGNIDCNKAAKIACCSTYHFQRMFSYIAGVPLSEYIRQRKMTLAAFDLQKGGKVVDVSYKYGYESPTSFNRAFQKIHNVSPSIASKEGTVLKAYPPISFKITIKGVKDVEYQVITRNEIRIVGFKKEMSKNIEENFQEVPKFWGEVSQNNKLNEVISLMDENSKGVLGVSACIDIMDKWEYYIGVETNKEIKEGMCEYIIQPCTWAVFPGKGRMPEAIQEVEKRAITEWLPSSSYEYANQPDIELYLNSDPLDSVFEVWIPIKEK